MWIKVTSLNGKPIAVNMDRVSSFGALNSVKGTVLTTGQHSFVDVQQTPEEIDALMGLEQPAKASEGLGVPQHVREAAEAVQHLRFEAAPPKGYARTLADWVLSLGLPVLKQQAPPWHAEFDRGYAKGKADCGQQMQKEIDAAYRRGHQDGQTFYAQGKAVTTALGVEYTRGYRDATAGRMPMPNAKG